jgi:hypothetical protein
MRRRRNFIHSLEHNGNTLISEDAKLDAVLDFFEQVLATPLARAHHIKLEMLDLPHLDLTDIISRFSEEEVWSVIRSLPPDKAPGTDGFPTRFLQTAWPVIRHDIMCTFDAFSSMDAQDFHKINEAS